MFKSHKGVFKLLGIICALTIIIGALYTPIILAVKAADIVNVTFVDALNNTETTITGNKGEGFDYPTDPVDKNGQKWFMGWFTDETYQTEHENGVFGNSDVTLYAKWLGKNNSPSLYQDFENYTKEQWELKDPVNDIRKNNRDYFFEGASKQSDITYNNSGNAIKIDWDAEMVKDATDPNTYDASGRWRSIDCKINLDLRVENNVAYNITFKYYVEKADTDFTFSVHSAWDGSVWSNRKDYGSIACRKTVGWHEATATFTTNYDSTTYNTMFLIMNLSENKDVIVYIDDIAIEAVQPYDSYVIVKTGLGTEEMIKGVRGETINFPELTHPLKAPFKGYYLDADCTEELTEALFQRKDLVVYAKWGAAPLYFDDYIYEIKDRAIYSVFIKNDKNVGYDDDYALQFLFDGDATYQRPQDSEPTYYYKRYRGIDSTVKIADVNSGSVYKVSYYRRASEDTISDFSITLLNGNYANIWAPVSVTYEETKRVVKAYDKEWVQETIYFIPNFTDPLLKSLYLLFNSVDGTPASYVDGYVDNVVVEELKGSIIYFDGNAEGLNTEAISGKAGSTFTAPTFKNGKSEFLGWYLDAECTTPFTETTIPEGITTVYAKWSIAPLSFEKFPYDLLPVERAYYTFFIKEGKDVGYNDNAALNFFLDGDKTYKRPNDSQATVFYTRAHTKDSSIKVAAALDAGALYKVSFYAKSGKNSQSDYSIMLASGDAVDIWYPSWKEHLATKTTIKASDKSWKCYEFFISPTASDSSRTTSALYLQFNSLDQTENAYVDAYLDELTIEKIDPPYIFFDHTEAEETTFIKGEVGEEIVPPNAKLFAKVFTGWYTDPECTTEFTETHFKDGMATTVYAGWKDATEVTYTFENFNIPHRGEDSKLNIRRDIHLKPYAKAISGKNVLEVDRTHNQTHSSYVPLAYGEKVHIINNENLYVITLNYCVSQKLSGSMTIRALAATPNNYWGAMSYGSAFSIPADTEVGKWKKAVLVLDGKKLAHEAGNGVFLDVVGGTDGKIYIDDVTIKTVPLGNQVVVIDNGECNKIPTVLYGKTGQSFASKLPTSPVIEGRYFKGYYVLDESKNYVELKPEEMKFGKDAIAVYARFIKTEVYEDFESDSVRSAINMYDVFSVYDFDYELYDSTLAGNSADNVTSGKYSLHRKGNTNYTENALVLGTHNGISEGERYTVTFKVKLGEHKHTNGAIKIASCRNHTYSWDTMGDYYAVASIAELADGQWHEVSYTFNSIESFVSVQTPGSVELFFDDFKFTLANDTPLSEDVTYTEHLIGVKANSEGVDISTIIDSSLLESSVSVWLIVGIAAGALVLAAVIVLGIVLIKRKKA